MERCAGSQTPNLKLRTAVRHPGLNGGALFVVVPGNNEQEGKRTGIIVVAAVEAQGFFKSLAAARVHAAVARPSGTGVVKARPGGAHGNLARIVRDHLRIK